MKRIVLSTIFLILGLLFGFQVLSDAALIPTEKVYKILGLPYDFIGLFFISFYLVGLLIVRLIIGALFKMDQKQIIDSSGKQIFVSIMSWMLTVFISIVGVLINLLPNPVPFPQLFNLYLLSFFTISFIALFLNTDKKKSYE